MNATSIDRSALSNLENQNNENPTVDTIDRVAKALGKKVVVTLEDA